MSAVLTGDFNKYVIPKLNDWRSSCCPDKKIVVQNPAGFDHQTFSSTETFTASMCDLNLRRSQILKHHHITDALAAISDAIGPAIFTSGRKAPGMVIRIGLSNIHTRTESKFHLKDGAVMQFHVESHARRSIGLVHFQN
jgi:hypothetical protein